MCMDPKPKNPKENKITVLGLGRSGGKIVHYLQEQEADYNLIYVDDDEQSLMESTVKSIGITDCEGKDIETLVRAIGNSEKLVVVTGMGGNKVERGAYIVVRSLGSVSKPPCQEASKQICDMLTSDYDLNGSNIYITYHPADLWGWNGSMF